jgi:hypothetical protein
MSAIEVIYFQVICDGCGADAHEGGEFSAYADDALAREDAGNSVDYLTDLGEQRLDFCRKCTPVARTDEQDDCEHGKVSSASGGHWHCNACGMVFGPPASVPVPGQEG